MAPLARLSGKIDRTSKVHPGQIAGAAEARRPQRMPATKVPCRHALLSTCSQTAPIFPGISRMLSPARSGWLRSTGPSISPIRISGRPVVRSINAASPTTSAGRMLKPFTGFVLAVFSGTLPREKLNELGRKVNEPVEEHFQGNYRRSDGATQQRSRYLPCGVRRGSCH
jgi:hypothetical protein